jgi:hypothetical protein
MVPAGFASAPNSPGTTRLVGALVGACLATKTSALPLLLTLLVFRDRKSQLIAACSAALTAIVLTMVVASHYGEIVRFNLRIMTHTGRWGGGEFGIIDPSHYFGAVIALYGPVPKVFISAALCLALATLLPVGILRSDKFDLTRLFIVAAAVMIAQMAIVARDTQTHYLVPVAATVCLANGAISYVLVQGGWWRRILGLLVVGVVLAHGIWHGGRAAFRGAHINGTQQHDDSAVQARFESTDCKQVYAYGNKTIPYKLYFGDQFAGGQYIGRLHQLYPNVVFYHENGRFFDTAEGILDTAQANEWVAKQNCVYLFATTVESFTPEAFGILPDRLTLLDRSHHGPGSVAVYRIEPAPAGASIFVPRR